MDLKWKIEKPAYDTEQVQQDHIPFTFYYFPGYFS